MSETILASLPDPVVWHDQGDCIYMSILNFDVGFYKPYGCFALRPGGIRDKLSEPAIYTLVRPWFYIEGKGWNRFNAQWSTTTEDYAGLNDEAWDSTQVFGWNHEFNVQDPPVGVDCQIRNYVQLLPGHQSYKYITKITPYFNLDNLGIEYAHFVKSEYLDRISTVYVEKGDGSFVHLPLQQVKNIEQDISNAILKIGLVYNASGEEQLLYTFGQEWRTWDHREIKTEQVNVQGEDFWVVRIGGAHLANPRPLKAYSTFVL